MTVPCQHFSLSYISASDLHSLYKKSPFCLLVAAILGIRVVLTSSSLPDETNHCIRLLCFERLGLRQLFGVLPITSLFASGADPKWKCLSLLGVFFVCFALH